MNGIVIIDKPQEWTSQDVTARLRRVFQTRRIGHGGTLDPMATGVLPVFVGRGTRGVEFFEHAEKTYETVLRLGITTDTEDISGFPRTIAGVKMAATLRENGEDGVKMSIRAVPGYDAAAVCAKFGGGGHKGAAGASIALPLAEAAKEVEKAMLEL